MIGKIYTSVFPYFDSSVRQMKYKNRPVLIIGGQETMIILYFHYLQ